MNDRPGWILSMYKRGSAGHALHTAFLLNFTNENIAELADIEPDGRDQLRQVALSELGSEDPQVVALSLVFLGVVGRPEDLPAVLPFVDGQSDLVRRAARACQFELRQVEGRNKGIGKGDIP